MSLATTVPWLAILTASWAVLLPGAAHRSRIRWPALLLQPEPGQRILDLCAAPGNKTAQLAVSMANRGTVVANDINYSRMRAVRHTLDRLGLVNTSITTADGANIPKTAGQFDMVLADVPCSGEGMARKDPLVLLRAGPELAYKKQGLQIALLRKAVQRCKPGGRIVYAARKLLIFWKPSMYRNKSSKNKLGGS